MSKSPQRPLELSTPCQFLKGVGPVRARDLERLEIATVEDLLRHFPRDYLDRTRMLSLDQVRAGEQATVEGTVLVSGERRPRKQMRLLSVMIDDGHGRLQLIFFNQPYLRQLLPNGTRIIASGEVSVFGGSLQMSSPEIEILGSADEGPTTTAGGVIPVYPLTRGLTQRWFRVLMRRVLDDHALMGEIGEILPLEWLAEKQWPQRSEAFRQIHFADETSAHTLALERFKFEELFFLQVMNALRHRRMQKETGPKLGDGARLLTPFLDSLPFSLTAAQARVLGEIRGDLDGQGRMNRLLQGDVGSGKTVVALAALLLAVEVGLQGAFMAPTEILAGQHYEGWTRPLGDLGLRCALLTGSTPAAAKRETLAALAQGEINIIFGTHALIQDKVEFAALGLAVVDEQHRFGVVQRATIRGEANPHVLVMSATPIPRSLAMTVFGDLDLSIIDEMPPGRPEILTRLVREEKLDKAYGYVRERVATGERAFLLFPLVEESDKMELKAAKEEYDRLTDTEFADLSCDLLHGRMSGKDKAAAMERFRSGETSVLVATTVIEVGIDVPEATLMLIHHPERFGLSQLHQLRGRIGRGSRKSWCLLITSPSLGEGARRRLAAFVDNHDGFALAEEDLKLRGPGEFFGVRQHGRPELRLAHPVNDADLVALARERARTLVERDPELLDPSLSGLRSLLLRSYRDRINLAEIG